MANHKPLLPKQTSDTWPANVSDVHEKDILAGKEIDKIHEPHLGDINSGALSLPTPLARMHLFRQAFEICAQPKDKSPEIYTELISHTLDMWELAFDWANRDHDKLGITAWPIRDSIAALKEKSNKQHQRLGRLLKLYFEDDKTTPLRGTDNLYIFTYKTYPFACSSPYTGFFTLARFPEALRKEPLLSLDGKSSLFVGEPRRLEDRPEALLEYLYKLRLAYKGIDDRIKPFFDYLARELNNLPEKLRERLNQPGDDYGHDDFEKEYEEEVTCDNASLILTKLGTKENDKNGTQLILRHRPQTQDVPQDCAFFIHSKKFKEEGSSKKPLVLASGQADGWMYIEGPWNDKTPVPKFVRSPELPEDARQVPEELGARTLPGTNMKHPWLTVDDFLERHLLMVDYPVDDKRFYIIPIKDGEDLQKGFLLPLRPYFFEFFEIEDVQKMMTLKVNTSKGKGVNGAKVTLSIPVGDGSKRIEFKRDYINHGNDTKWQPGEGKNEDQGLILSGKEGGGGLPLNLAIFPFAQQKAAKKEDFDQLNGYSKIFAVHHKKQIPQLALSAFDQENKQIEDEGTSGEVRWLERERPQREELGFSTPVFELRGKALRYLRVETRFGENKGRGLVYPTLEQKEAIHDHAECSIDLGTTNTHVAVKIGNKPPEDFVLPENEWPLMAALNKPRKQVKEFQLRTNIGEGSLADKLDVDPANNVEIFTADALRYNFMPPWLSRRQCKFPTRTAMVEAQDIDNKASRNLFDTNNLFFFYDYEAFNQVDAPLTTSLKWQDAANSDEVDTHGYQLFIEELMRILKAWAISQQISLDGLNLRWFKPLSMYTENIDKKWNKTIKDVFGNSATDRLSQLSESEAPYYFYKNARELGDSTRPAVIFDIGGGSTDMLLVKPKDDKSEKGYIGYAASCRFAGNALYSRESRVGEAPHGLWKRFETQLLENLQANDVEKRMLYDKRYAHLKDSIEHFNFAFSNQKETGIQDLLEEDGNHKLGFLLHFLALNFYAAQLIAQLPAFDQPPADILFSGNGSRYLKFLEDPVKKGGLLQTLASEVYQRVLELDDPAHKDYQPKIHCIEGAKTITCRGGLLKDAEIAIEMPERDKNAIWHGLKEFDESSRYDVYTPPKRQDVSEVIKDWTYENSSLEAFFKLFCELASRDDVRNKLGIDYKPNQLEAFAREQGKEALNQGESIAAGGRELDETVPEPLFFYPIRKIMEAFFDSLNQVEETPES